MKYILADDYIMRGFDHGKITALININSGAREYPSSGMMMLLQMCDGKTDSSLYAFMPGTLKGLELALQKGWIKPAEADEQIKTEQVYRELPTHDIASIQWSITGACNANCRHCYITDHQRSQTDLTTEEMLKVIERLADACVYHVSLTGGEPLVRKDLPVLLNTMREKHIKVTALSTNGFLLDDGMLDMFSEHGMRPKIQISFDGLGKHDWMRRVPGAEKMAVVAMENCKKHGFPFALAMCLHQDNKDLIDSTVKLGMEKGAELIRLCMVGNYGGFTPEKGISLLSMEETYQLYLDYLPVILREKPDIDIEFSGCLKINGSEPEKAIIIPYIHSCMDPENNRVCQSVEKSFYLTDDGRVLPCMIVAGNAIENDCLKLSEQSLESCMNSPGYKKFLALTAKDVLAKNTQCADCEYLKYCGCGCRGASIIANNDLYGIDIDRCRFYRNGWGTRFEKLLFPYTKAE